MKEVKPLWHAESSTMTELARSFRRTYFPFVFLSVGTPSLTLIPLLNYKTQHRNQSKVHFSYKSIVGAPETVDVCGALFFVNVGHVVTSLFFHIQISLVVSASCHN